jgi:pSer/pThr/pTyr-binding forkhead associated (FHA) protein
MGKQLVVIAGLERGRVLRLDDTDILQLGCSQTLEVCARFRDPDVARVHCEVQVHGDRVMIVDADTPNGTFLNGQRISQQELHPGDVIRIGKTELKFLSDTTQAKSTPSGVLAVPKILTNPAPSAPETAPVAAQPLKPQQATAAHLAVLVGKTLDRYQIEVALGAATWGRVFRARDIKLNRNVALKVLRPEFGADEEIVQQFRQALKTVVPFQHSNLVTHFGAGKAGPFCWIAMEYVEGKSLSQVIRHCSKAGLGDWRDAFRVLAQVTKAIEFAHQHQIIHGNITPRDILVRDADKVTKLGDLILACTLGHLITQPFSTPGERPDAIQYMSPERTEGMEIGRRSDLYSIGAVVYSLLTGRPLFQAISQGELITKVRQEEPVTPRKYQPTMHHEFGRIVLKMLQKDPADRFQSATELSAELGRVGKTCGISAE